MAGGSPYQDPAQCRNTWTECDIFVEQTGMGCFNGTEMQFDLLLCVRGFEFELRGKVEAALPLTCKYCIDVSSGLSFCFADRSNLHGAMPDSRALIIVARMPDLKTASDRPCASHGSNYRRG